MFTARQASRRLLAKAKGRRRVALAVEDGSDQLPDRYMEAFPEDPLQPVTPRKIALQLSMGVLYHIRNDRIDSLTLDTVEEGRIEIHKRNAQDVYRILPGLIQLHYNPERTDKWYTGGGFLFNYYFGAVHLALIDAYKLDELDVSVVQANIEKAKAQLKAKSEKRRVYAEIVTEFLEPLADTLEKYEFEFLA